jgi:glycosyltransferase involved in cell wall biosynthesis
MKRVLIITYYWPPAGGSGVQRWLKFARYLPENGWQPVIYTPENPEWPVLDESLLADVPPEAEVITHPIFEPYGLYKRLTGRGSGEAIQVGFVSESGRSDWKETLSRWVRGNCLIPDARRFWIGPSARRLSAWLRESPVDAIVSTGPPHSMHLIALRLHRRTGIPWLADFRDPWSRFYYNSDLLFSARTLRRHERLERQVLQEATRVVTVSNHIATELAGLGGRPVDVIHNGFDPADYAHFNRPADHPAAPHTPSPTSAFPRGLRVLSGSSHFSITHTGAFQPAANPSTLWQVLGNMVRKDPSFSADLRLILVGKVDSAVRDAIDRHGLTTHSEYTGYVPHTDVMHHQVGAALLLLCILKTEGAEGIITGKFFEYLASGTPILCIGPEDGDTARIIRDCGAGTTAGFDDAGAMERIIGEAYRGWKTTGEQANRPENRETGTAATGQTAIINPAVMKYSRQALTGELAAILNRMI